MKQVIYITNDAFEPKAGSAVFESKAPGIRVFADCLLEQLDAGEYPTDEIIFRHLEEGIDRIDATELATTSLKKHASADISLISSDEPLASKDFPASLYVRLYESRYGIKIDVYRRRRRDPEEWEPYYRGCLGRFIRHFSASGSRDLRLPVPFKPLITQTRLINVLYRYLDRYSLPNLDWVIDMLDRFFQREDKRYLMPAVRSCSHDPQTIRNLLADQSRQLYSKLKSREESYESPS